MDHDEAIATLAVLSGSERLTESERAELRAAEAVREATPRREWARACARAMGNQFSSFRDMYAPDIPAQRAANHPGETYLYRHYGPDGTLLYVGVTSDPEMRWKRHLEDSPWSSLVHLTKVELVPTRKEALARERAAIRLEEPIYNQQLAGGAVGAQRRGRDYEAGLFR